MSFCVKHACALMFALPAAALAAPVTVTTHSTGTTDTDPTILSALGLDPAPATGPLPYELTLTSTFDPGINLANDVYSYGGKVEIDFRLGSQVYVYDGIADSLTARYDQSPSVDAYQQRIWLFTPGPGNANYKVYFANTLYGLPRGTTESLPLRPYGADEGDGDGLTGYYSIDAHPGNPDVPLQWQMSGSGTALSVQVAAVPEPAAFALLGAGLATLALRRRFRA